MGNLACCQSTWCAQTQPYVFQRLWKEGGHGEEEKEKEVKKGVGDGGQICVLCSVATLSFFYFSRVFRSWGNTRLRGACVQADLALANVISFVQITLSYFSECIVIRHMYSNRPVRYTSPLLISHFYAKHSS